MTEHPLKIWERLTELSELEDGWLDGQGKAPSRDVLELAGRLVTTMPRHAIGPVSVYPTAPGGAQLEWGDEYGDHALEILPDLHLHLLTVEKGERDEVKALRAEVAAARKFAAEMGQFCSPHGVASGYADQLEAAMDRARNEGVDDGDR